MTSKKIGLGVVAACGVACAAPLFASSVAALAAGLSLGGFSTGSLLAGVSALGAAGLATAMLIRRPRVFSGLRGQAEPADGFPPGGALELRTFRQTPPTSACSQGQKGACCGPGEPSAAG